MQLRRIAIAVVVAAALGALVWFMRGQHEQSASALDAPVKTESVRTDPGAAPIETPPAEDARTHADVPTAPDEDPARHDALSTSPRSAVEEASGLLVRVLDPDGQPLPGALLSSVASGNGPLSVDVPRPTDASGSRRYGVRAGVSRDLRASDPNGRYGPAYAFDIGPDRRKLDMRLEATTPHTLVVVDEQGAPIERFAWRLLDERQYVSRLTGMITLDENGRLADTILERAGVLNVAISETDQQAHPGERVEFRIGSLAFAVQVEAPDFDQAQVGPMAAADAPSEVRVVLQRLPGIRGRVLHEGKGVPGAWVKLLRPSRNGRQLYVNGFPTSTEAWATAESTTDDEGRFALQLRQTGEYFIRAGATGLCLAELGPRRFEAHQGAEGLELVVPAAGAIEGRVLFAETETHREWIIAASHGDGLPRSVHTDPEGRFRFESLSPGEWVLRPTETDLVPDVIQSISDGDDFERTLHSTCVVRAGESTHVEFDLRVKAVLTGTCEFPGWEKAECSCSLDAIGSAFSRAARFESIHPGRVRAEVDQPGEYRLLISWRDNERSCSLGLSDQVRLQPGENAWTFEPAMGELVLVNALEVEQWATLRCELGEARRAISSAKLAPREERRIIGLPVGKWVLVRRNDGPVREDTSVEVVADSPARIEVH